MPDTDRPPIPPPRPSPVSQLRLMRRLLHTPERALDELRRTVGPVSGLGAGPLRMVVVGAPDLVRELLVMPSERFRYDNALSPFPFVVGERSMLASDGEDHHRRRSSVQGAFTRKRLDGWIPMIVDRTDAAIDDLVSTSDPSRPVDLYPVGRRLLIDVVIRTLFGARLAGHTDEIDDRFRRIQDFLSAPLWRQAPHPFPFTLRAGVRADRAALDRIIDAEIAACRRDGDRRRDDVLDALVHDGVLDDAEIRDQVKTLIGAGYDTTASSLAWMLWEATLCDGLWRRLRVEADRVLGHVGAEPPDAASLAALVVANHTMRETLRLHPASGVAVRQAATDLTLGGHAIAAGTHVVWSPYLTGRDSDVWADPLRFDPDRFADLDAGGHESGHESGRSAASLGWIPFGRGPRSCIGLALAQMELTLVIARLAQRLDLTPVAAEPPAAAGLVVSKPVGGAPMRVAPRELVDAA